MALLPHFFPFSVFLADSSSMEPTIRASMGGALPGNQAAATEPVETSTRSPTPQPSTSKATSRVPLPSSISISSSAPLGSSFRRLVDHTLPITIARCMSFPLDLDAQLPGLVPRQWRQHDAPSDDEPFARLGRSHD